MLDLVYQLKIIQENKICSSSKYTLSTVICWRRIGRVETEEIGTLSSGKDCWVGIEVVRHKTSLRVNHRLKKMGGKSIINGGSQESLEEMAC